MRQAGEEEISLGEQFCRFVRAGLQPGQARLGLGQQLERLLVGSHQLLQRSGSAGKPRHRPLEVGQELVETTLAHVAVAATRPRMPLTKRPASSPENVLASAIDSLIAALVGTRRSIAIS